YGRIYVSPISWYAKTSEWDLSPNYRPDNHPRFDRRANDGCLNCHVGRLHYERGVSDRYGSPPFLELGISCERCHGPGRDHADLHEARDTAGASDPIVNPAALGAGARDDVCNQCHLQGEKRILRYGRTFHDFSPGMRLEEVWTVFVAGPRTEG